jgi:hypothetical protein
MLICPFHATSRLADCHYVFEGDRRDALMAKRRASSQLHHRTPCFSIRLDVALRREQCDLTSQQLNMS